MNTYDKWTVTFSVILLAGLLGSSCDEDTAADAGSVDAGPVDSGPADSGRADAGPGVFAFRTDAPAAYVRMDRAGMPLVAAGLITDDDGFNLGDPADDVSGDAPTYRWGAEIIGNLNTLHDALRDDLVDDNGLTPCADFSGASANSAPCVLQEVAPGVAVANLVIPDTLKIDTTAARAFPNGRGLADPVADVTLAVIFLDLSVHGADTFAALPLNPAANDASFSDAFPYLAAPHTP